MRSAVFTRMEEPHFIAGAGHWVQQERPEATVVRILEFLHANKNQ
jgi:pimeloyl-ACP methyl ester carboxylesterase